MVIELQGVWFNQEDSERPTRVSMNKRISFLIKRFGGKTMKDEHIYSRMKVLNECMLQSLLKENGKMDSKDLQKTLELTLRTLQNMITILENQNVNSLPIKQAALTKTRVAYNVLTKQQSLRV
jgi:hypothetical protein